MKWQWDWMHTVLAVAIVAATTVMVVMGKGQVVMQLIAVASGGLGVGALFKDSPRQPAPLVVSTKTEEDQ